MEQPEEQPTAEGQATRGRGIEDRQQQRGGEGGADEITGEIGAEVPLEWSGGREDAAKLAQGKGPLAQPDPKRPMPGFVICRRFLLFPQLLDFC